MFLYLYCPHQKEIKMPRGKTNKEFINKTIFMELIRYKKSSIRQLGKLESITCTERTIRRSLNEGLITHKFLDQIARQLDLDPELLSGKLHKHADSIDDPILKQLYLNTLSPDQHPYYKKIYTEQIKKPIADFLSSLLSFFKISYKQLNEFPFETQYQFQYDFFEAIIPIIDKYFKTDGYGNPLNENLYLPLAQLETYYEQHEMEIYALQTLRSKFLQNLPKGYTKQQISKMSSDELIELDRMIQWESQSQS